MGGKGGGEAPREWEAMFLLVISDYHQIHCPRLAGTVSSEKIPVHVRWRRGLNHQKMMVGIKEPELGGQVYHEQSPVTCRDLQRNLWPG